LIAPPDNANTEGSPVNPVALSAFGDDTMTTPFPQAGSARDLETNAVLTPRFDAHGLVTAVVTDAGSGEVLMLAHMNAEALALTISTRQAWYWSRSRGELWRKGATSGHVQEVIEMRVDCDQDAVWIKVRQTGAACHTGAPSCFYRQVALGDAPSGSVALSR
jgi:phosphoribosyl-AMP cyclohydrolase